MNKPPTEEDHNMAAHSSLPSWCHNSLKLFLHILVTFVVLFTLFQIHSLHLSFPYSWTTPFPSTSKQQHESISSELSKLRQSVTFLPLKDLRYLTNPQEGNTWFMSSLYDIQVEGEVKYLKFPSESSKGRVLCVKGRNTHDGAWNYYALAWREALPENATLMKGLTFVSYNHYIYDNIWHGLSAMVVPFAAWHLRNGCRAPERWVLYYMGELRTQLRPWLVTLMEGVYGTEGVKIEAFEGVEEMTPVCFEEAVVMRHNEGGVSRSRMEQVYDLLRCKARAFCNVGTEEKNKTGILRVSMLMRSGGRSFKNDTHVIGIFERECRKIQGCRLQVAYSNNLTVCQQVMVMSETDVLISPHGAQMSNMFLMDKGSSVMEFFPKGWLKLFGAGQFVFQWLADWSGMDHKGVWRDPDGPTCQYPEDDARCMDVFKDGQIGHNETHFSEWARTVFNQARAKKVEGAHKPKVSEPIGCGCP